MLNRCPALFLLALALAGGSTLSRTELPPSPQATAAAVTIGGQQEALGDSQSRNLLQHCSE